MFDYVGEKARSNRPLELAGFDCQFPGAQAFSQAKKTCRPRNRGRETGALPRKNSIKAIETLLDF